MGIKKRLIYVMNSVSSSVDLLLFVNTMLLLFGATLVVYELQHEFQEIRTNLTSTPLGFSFFLFAAFLLTFKVFFLIFMFFKFRKYKAVESVSDDQLPYCTIIVPAYNEGKLVWETLNSLAKSNYPKEKLQLIAIDDGSKDDTWMWMQKAKEELGDYLSIYQQAQNQGKRHALHRGFLLGTGNVFVTVDSDSLVTKNSIRNLVSPLAINEKCGAVAGNVRVLNNKIAIIPKMLNVSFAFSFEFIRSAQSTMGSVLCTPGALAAYRKDAVMACLPEWINQTFMGNLTDIGEDRAMTNMILKQGYHVQFQSNAHVLTNIPESFNGLRKMFTRWERSNVRENIMMAKFAFKKFREDSRFGPRILLFNQWLSVLAAYPLTIAMLMLIVMHPFLFFSSALVSIFFFASIPALFYALNHNFKKSFFAYTYGIFYSFCLFWITPYAIATASRRGWLTRGLSEKKAMLGK
jgi:hyaluronan synthase